MANEAVILEYGIHKARNYTVADGASISKGTLCKVADPNTASAATGTGEAFAGIAAEDKVANDGSTTLGLFTEGIFDLTAVAAPAITAGAIVCMSGANLIRTCVAGDLLTGAVVGKVLETSSASEVIRVAVGAFS
jgi:hypothetical protein